MLHHRAFFRAISFEAEILYFFNGPSLEENISKYASENWDVTFYVVYENNSLREIDISITSNKKIPYDYWMKISPSYHFYGQFGSPFSQFLAELYRFFIGSTDTRHPIMLITGPSLDYHAVHEHCFEDG